MRNWNRLETALIASVWKSGPFGSALEIGLWRDTAIRPIRFSCRTAAIVLCRMSR